jgi:hypothetical protein
VSKFAGLTLRELLDLEILGFFALQEYGGRWLDSDRAGYDRRFSLWREVRREITSRNAAGETVPKDRDTGR